jgi:hypothetical protein
VRLVDPVSQILDLLPVLVPSGAAVTAAGMILLERVRGRNRIAEIHAETAGEIAKIEATNQAEIAKLHVELELERERNRALTSSQLSIGPPPPG